MADKKHRVLVAEDEKPLAEALSVKLSNHGYEVVVTYNGQQAVDALRKDSFDIAVIDLVMPEMDGFEVLELLQEEKIHLPVIVVSNLAQESDRDRALKLGAHGYFVKSNTPLSQLVTEVETALA